MKRSPRRTRNSTNKFSGTRTLRAGPIAINAMSPEGRDLLEQAMDAWKSHKKELPKKFCGKRYAPGIYGFAYWLIRYSGLVQPAKVSLHQQRKVAEKIADALLVNGAEQLAIKKFVDSNVTGWSREGVVNQISEILRNAS